MRAITAIVAPVSLWNAADANAAGTLLSNGGLTIATTVNTNDPVPASDSWYTVRNTFSQSSGKQYIEFAILGVQWMPSVVVVGLAGASFNTNTWLGTNANSGGIFNTFTYVSGAFTRQYNITLPLVVGDVVALAVDFGAGKVWFARNNVWANGSNPATGTLPIMTFVPATVGPLFAGASFTGPSDVWTIQANAASQKYAPPSGFTSWDPVVSPQAGVTTQALIRLDNYATAVLGGAIVCSGGGAFTLQHSNDDPNDLVNPVPLGSMSWDNGLLPPAVQGGSTSLSFQILAAPLYLLLTLTSSVGSVRATFLQVGEHSHSNISQGPFAPPLIGAASVTGTNFGAMAQ